MLAKNITRQMEITGKIIAVLPERGGTSSRTGSEWKVASYVLETMDQYPRKLAFEVFGAERIQQFAIQLGETMTVSFDVDAREYNGRWYNTIRAFRVDRNIVNTGAAPVPPPSMEPFGGSMPTQAPQAAPGVVSDLTAGAPFESGSSDDLPF